ncbi:DUF6869 domain-containing protein [Cryptosporangium sp. NPDC048952]|uniref:DUF6869 domain-containing protein n=1 Tax=Cryptosporangium sp. NPDC048952 TaxID=3363961 RepID=UPI00371EB65F
MIESVAYIAPDGQCEYHPLDDPAVVWQSPDAFAEAWMAERRSDDLGPTWTFLWHACADVQPGVVTVVIALAKAAADDRQLLSEIGAGPLEDLIRHAGNNHELLDEIERAARQEPAFRDALASMWLSSDVPGHVRQRLVPFGVADLSV